MATRCGWWEPHDGIGFGGSGQRPRRPGGQRRITVSIELPPFVVIDGLVRFLMPDTEMGPGAPA
jgi:hypothetical protein